jgi:hypothetical protein
MLFQRSKKSSGDMYNSPLLMHLKKLRLAPDVCLGIEREWVQLLHQDVFDHIERIEAIE